MVGAADCAANYAGDDEEGHDGDPDDAPFATVPGLHLLSSSIRGFRGLLNGNDGPRTVIECSAARVRDWSTAIATVL